MSEWRNPPANDIELCPSHGEILVRHPASDSKVCLVCMEEYQKEVDDAKRTRDD